MKFICEKYPSLNIPTSRIRFEGGVYETDDPIKISKLMDMCIRKSHIRAENTISDIDESLSVEVILLVWQRVDNLPDILSSLEKQTYKNFTVRVHNNNLSESLRVENICLEYTLNIKLSHSDNEGSVKKLELGRESESDVLIFLDDDMIPLERLVEYSVLSYQGSEKTIFGWYGYVFNSESYWQNRLSPVSGSKLDYIGSGSMVCGKEIFQIKELHDIPDEAIEIEDLWLSYIARKNGYNLIKIDRAVKHNPDKHDQYNHLRESKEVLFRYLRSKGWELLIDLNLDFVITIPTYNRPDYCLELLKSIKSAMREYKIKVIVINDGSKEDYSKVTAYIRRYNWDYIRNYSRNGKRRYWATVSELWKKARRYNFKYAIHLNDDFNICDNLFFNIEKFMSILPDNACLNIWNDYRVKKGIKQWGNVPKAVKIKGHSFNVANWFDGGNVYPYKALESLGWKVNDVGFKRWDIDPNLSSGVWRQISGRLVKTGYRIYALSQSMVYHRDYDKSMMNPGEREKNNLDTYDYDSGFKVKYV